MRRILLLLLAAAIIFPSCSLDALERTMNGFGDWIGGDAETPDTSKVTNAIENIGNATVNKTENGFTLELDNGKTVSIDFKDGTSVDAMLPSADDSLKNDIKEQIYTDGNNKAFANAMAQPVTSDETKKGMQGSATIVSSAINDAMSAVAGKEGEYEDIFNAINDLQVELDKLASGETAAKQGDVVTVMLATDLAMDVLDMVTTDAGAINENFNPDDLSGEQVDSLLSSVQLLSDFTTKVGESGSSLSGSMDALMDAAKKFLK